MIIIIKKILIYIIQIIRKLMQHIFSNYRYTLKILANQNNMFYIINIKYYFKVIICCDDNVLTLTYHFMKTTLTFLLTYKNVIITTNILIQHKTNLNI